MKNGVLHKLFWTFCSLKFAVVEILAIAAAVAAGTIYESLYDTPTAQFWIYRSFWFHAILFVLGLNILLVALSRLPWKKRHIPFLMAHAGILILLIGSWITQEYGLDGSVRVSEGETSGVVIFDGSVLVVRDATQAIAVPIEWLPPDAIFKPISVAKYGLAADLKVDQYLSHAEPIYSFLPKEKPDSMVTPAVKVRLSGGPMRVNQDFWLWGGDPNWARTQAGPALLVIGEEPSLKSGQPTLVLSRDGESGIEYKAYSSQGKLIRGRFASRDKAVGAAIDPNWKGVKVQITDWVPDAKISTTFKMSRVLYGNQAPPAAIHLVTGSGKGESEVWLGHGERASLVLNDRILELGFFPRRVVLPFSVRLERFNIDHYEGTRDPASYSSKVSIVDQSSEKKDITISMNEPLEYRGYTFYQSSYEDAMPRPVTSIFSVNRDPGRIWKYLGSILIVLGSILLFAMKYYRKKQEMRGQNAS